jgi:Tfp pilus assembly protein PilO
MNRKMLFAALVMAILVAIVGYILLSPNEMTSTEGLTQEQTDQKQKQVEVLQQQIKKVFQQRAQQPEMETR